jgi:hypothetical protein
MLPTSHQLIYQKFLNVFLALQKEINSSNFKITAVKEKLQQGQEIFQQEILRLDREELDPTLAARLVPIQTEIHRALRLLATDILFLSSSKQATTTEQRLMTVRDCTEKIIGYCQVILT